MKYLIILFILTGCSTEFKPKFKVGQYITNGYCKGQVASVIYDNYKILNAVCGKSTFNHLYIKDENARLID